MRFLITGINGLLGYELGHLLLKKKENTVYGISQSNSQINASNYFHIQCDLEQATFLEKLPDEVDVIFHLAQSAFFREFPEKANSIFNVNVASTELLLDYSRKCNCKNFIYTSSGGVYGFGRDAFSEEFNLKVTKDLGFYLGSKLMGEILTQNYSSFFHTQIIRPFFIYGKRQNKKMLIPRLFESVRSGTEITLASENGITINPIHVSDAAESLIQAASLNSSNKINIAGVEELTIRQIALTMGEKINKSPVFRCIDNPPENLLGDISKMELLLNSPKVKLSEGLLDLL